ncbi:ROK family transcriptional regulator [Actinomadura macrotermitis]|uniref:N-acetylglucosamine repressor n=1 Tax=Actinomadura macrotermitis TaxID=2585200 RepID=A0A7K0C395_9ACTN|nr:ROK family transcriptional regulator [Actinomadura macrotermitis]MQY07911.1 N-acetylglucosamine repressor [Actinomadura macrotermitis]
MTASVPGTPSLLRAINDRAALEALLAHGSLSRPELGRLTGLSKPTAGQLLARLEQAGLVLRDGIREGSPGRTAELYRLNPAAAHAAALDVTPERIAATVADLAGTVLGEYELPTPGRSAGDVVARAAAAVDGAAAAAGLTRDRIDRAVIGIQGALDPATGRLGYASHLPGWHGPGICDRLAAGLGLPVEIENDVNLAALAELAAGQAAGVRDFVLLWVFAGVGMGIVLDGVLHRGATGGAGEIGYMPAADAPLVRGVRRGGTGPVQSLTGGPAVLRLLRAHGFRGHDATVALRRAVAALDGGAGPQAAERAEQARAALTELATRLAATLATVVAVLDPGMIVLSGDVLRAGGEPLRDLVEEQLHTLTVPRPTVRLGSVEGNPILAGALQLALRDVREEVFTRSLP